MFFSIFCFSLKAQNNTNPNIDFILVGDLGRMDIVANGSTFYETPNIDLLAKEGIRFTQAYAASPICYPTRASILTGKNPARIDLTQWIGGPSNPDYLRNQHQIRWWDEVDAKFPKEFIKKGLCKTSIL